MTVKMIISGAQTGAARAALDFAIEVGVPYGGWVPKGRKAEDGIIPDKYDQLLEMPRTGYPARTEQNVLKAHGTLIISHGQLTGGDSLRTERLADQHERPCLHIDLTVANPSVAARKIITWISENGIEILNVAGPRASKDPTLYQDTLNLLKVFYQLAPVDKEVLDPQGVSPLFPRTIEEALEVLISSMALKDKINIAKMKEEELIELSFFGADIRNDFCLWLGNDALLKSCGAVSGKQDLDPDGASFLIIRKLWERLRATHSLRIVTDGKDQKDS